MGKIRDIFAVDVRRIHKMLLTEDIHLIMLGQLGIKTLKSFLLHKIQDYCLYYILISLT
jgi:hypothetical protein